jgi:calcineurin-like phosphoesterase family protein
MDFLVSADHHFGHKGILRRGRPFQTVEEMDEAMIDRHNARAGRTDHVFFCGDFSGSTDEKYLRKIFGALKGQKHLVLGNHDTRQVLSLPIEHFASHSWDQMYNGSYLLYGHTHGKLGGRGRSIDVGVDSWGYQPIAPDEAISAMKKYNADFCEYVPEQERIQRFHIHENDRQLIIDDGLDGRNYLEKNLRLEQQYEGRTLAQMRPQTDTNLFDDIVMTP